MDEETALSRLSFNQMTCDRWRMDEAIEGCARAGIRTIGLWRHKLAEYGLEVTARHLRTADLRVSSLCRGGYFPAATAAERQARILDNQRAIVEAATLGAPVVVLVCGPAPDRDIAAARKMVADGLAQLLPFAAAHGVRLGIEPLHPVFAADRSVITTLAEANDLIEQLDSPWVGVVIDVYHVWWDPSLSAQISRASGRIVGFHLNDWPANMGVPFSSRLMMGDGVIELDRITRAVLAAGYSGPIEVEILNTDLWAEPGDIVLARLCERYLTLMHNVAAGQH